ncbi:lectin C-type domain protein, partial [Oesophagostomum dentatum]
PSYTLVLQTAELFIFQRFERPRSYDDAENRCHVFGGHLTSIHSYMENEFVAKIAENGTFTNKTDRLTWIGLKRKNNTKTWIWSDGSPYGYHKWAGQPENKTQEKCAQMVSTFMKKKKEVILFKGLWHDANCSSNATFFICKKKA